MRNNQGFTLIEIMVVIVIVGITFGFALIAFGDFGESKRVLFAAEQLANTLRLAQQQAILESSTLGFRVDNYGYQILKLQTNSRWAPLSDRGVFKMTYFPKNVSVVLQAERHPTIGTPPVIITASGDMTPFTLTFGINKDNKIATLIGNRNGELKFQPLGDK